MTYVNDDTLVKDNVKVAFDDIGEGLHGEYDPDDISLLRFYVSVWDENDEDWRDVEDASYCTMLTSDASASVKRRALEQIMDAVYDILHEDSEASVKKICESLSWIGAQNNNK